MTAPRNGWWIAAALLLALVAVPLVLTAPEPAEVESAAATGAVEPPDAPSVAPVAQAEVEVTTDKTAAERSELATSGVSSSLPQGRIGLRFVDSQGRPVPDVGFIVHSERRRNAIAGAGRADGGGYASLEQLPEDAWIVTTERQPPFASTVAAVWLPETESREVDVVLDQGGTLTGRVVDDEGAPIAGVEIHGRAVATMADIRSSGPGVARAVAGPAVDTGWSLMATTGDDGRFVAPHVAPRPSGIWIDDQGRMAPERIKPAAFVLTTLDGDQRTAELLVTAQVAAGRATDVGTLRIERHATVRGQVVDTNGRAVEGVHLRVGLKQWANAGPGRRAATAVSDGDGAFELRLPVTADSGPVSAYWNEPRQARFGPRVGKLALPVLRPGETVDGLVVEVPESVPFVLTLLEQDGSPWVPEVDVDGDERYRLGERMPWPCSIVATDEREARPSWTRSEVAWLDLDGAAGSRLDSPVVPDDAGVAHGRVELAANRARRVALRFSRHAPTEVELVPDGEGALFGFARVEPLEQRALGLVRSESTPDGDLAGRIELRYGRNAANGKQRRSAFELNGAALPIEIDLLGPQDAIAPLEVALLDHAGEETVLAAYDELGPVGGRLQVEIRAGYVSANSGGSGAQPPEAPEAPEVDEPSVLSATLLFQVRSNIDGLGLGESTWVLSQEGRKDRRGQTDDRGWVRLRTSLVDVPWRLQVRHPLHRTLEVEGEALGAGGRRDLGGLELEPRPTFDLELVQQDDALVRSIVLDGVGTFRLDGDIASLPIPESSGPLLLTLDASSGSRPARQWHQLDVPAPWDRVRLEVDPWIEFTIAKSEGAARALFLQPRFVDFGPPPEREWYGWTKEHLERTSVRVEALARDSGAEWELLLAPGEYGFLAPEHLEERPPFRVLESPSEQSLDL